MSCGTRGPYIGKHDGHGHCPGACEAHAESMGVFASPEPKAEAAKPCADWCGLPQSDKRVPCGLGLSLVTYVKGTVFQHCSDACKDMALGAQLAPVVEKPRPLTCSCGSVELVAMRVVYKSPPRPVCQRCYLEGESHVFGGEEFYRLARLVDPKPRPAAHPGTVPQVFGLGVGVWASRGMAVKR